MLTVTVIEPGDEIYKKYCLSGGNNGFLDVCNK